MLGFVVAFIAGFATPHIEDPLARPLVSFLEDFIQLTSAELRLLAFIIAMLGAGIVASLLHSGSPFWMILGGALGYFATRLVAAGRKAMDDRKSD